MRFAILITALLGASPSQAQFALDLTHDKFQERQGIITLESLAVGESAYSQWPICVENGVLFVELNNEITRERNEYGRYTLVTRLPQGQAALEIQKGNRGQRADAATITEVIGSIARFSQSQRGGWVCEVPASRRLIVARVNGFESLSELLAAQGTAGK